MKPVRRDFSSVMRSPQIIKQVDGTGLTLQVHRRHLLYHPCHAARLVDMEVDESARIAAEYHLILCFSLTAHRYIHHVGILLGHAPVVRLMTIVVHCLAGHFGCQLTGVASATRAEQQGCKQG